MEKPTREILTEWLEAGKFGKVMTAYLALMEEVDRKEQMNLDLTHRVGCLEIDKAQLKAESEVLKEKLGTALTEIVPEKLIGLSIEGKNILDFWHVWIIQSKDEMAKLKAENEALKATMDNIYDNIKNLPAGHERFALDCIRKLLKPMEQERMGHGEDV